MRINIIVINVVRAFGTLENPVFCYTCQTLLEDMIPDLIFFY